MTVPVPPDGAPTPKAATIPTMMGFKDASGCVSPRWIKVGLSGTTINMGRSTVRSLFEQGHFGGAILTDTPESIRNILCLE